MSLHRAPDGRTEIEILLDAAEKRMREPFTDEYLRAAWDSWTAGLRECFARETAKGDALTPAETAYAIATASRNQGASRR